MVSGRLVSGTSSETYLTETIGRDGQAKAKRRMGGGQDAADRALKALLERDKEGMKAVTVMNRRKGRNTKCEQGNGDNSNSQNKVIFLFIVVSCFTDSHK